MPRKNNQPKYIRRSPDSSCQTKRRYKSKSEAQAAASYQMDLYLDVELTSYHCLSCGGWHLTSTES